MVIPFSAQRDIGGRKLVIETGKYALQANAGVTVQYGDSIVLVTACVSPKPRPGVDFVPLTVDFEERLYAAGRIPGSFFRREGRPSQEGILSMRLADRSLRPLLPKGLRNDVQVVVTVLSVDQENLPDVLAIIGASASLAISSIPFEDSVGATRVGYLDGEYIINPTYSEIDRSTLNVVVSGTKDAVVMVEAGADEVSEEVVLEAIRRAQVVNSQIVDMIKEMATAVGQPKMTLDADSVPEELKTIVEAQLNVRLLQVLREEGDKAAREGALERLSEEMVDRLGEEHSRDHVLETFEALLRKEIRSRIIQEGIRPDGRGPRDIRAISSEVGVLPRAHGSGLFTRGQTQVLSIATLASMHMKQRLDTISPEDSKRFIHHYNFPGFSNGEVKRVGSPGRREIGHGALAERALLPLIPSEETFPYTIRLVSEVLSSNGSTSMASVCGSALALMDAGVPIRSMAAGIAMGLVLGENGTHAILSDIQGIEDHLGDMDFKVAGTAQGINALQMDVKVRGLTDQLLVDALQQAKEGRLFILDKMSETISEPRSHLNPHAPRIIRITIPEEKIGAVIGPGGRVIRGISKETESTIDLDDSGVVTISSANDTGLQRAREKIEMLTRELAVGDIFTGRVVRLTNFGAFVELAPGRDGLLRSVEMGDDLRDDVKMGQELTVMVIEIDPLGRLNLSRRALMEGGEVPRQPQGGGPPRRPIGASRGPGGMGRGRESRPSGPGNPRFDRG